MKKILTTIEITISSIVFILYCVYLFASGLPPFGVLSVALNTTGEIGTRMFTLYCSGNNLLWDKGLKIIDNYIYYNVDFLKERSAFAEVRNWHGIFSIYDYQSNKLHNLIRGELILKWDEYAWYWQVSNDFLCTSFYYKDYGDILNVETAYTAISLMKNYYIDDGTPRYWVDHAREVVGRYDRGELQNLSKEDKQYIQEIKDWIKEYEENNTEPNVEQTTDSVAIEEREI